jgi:hypothetical protein
MEKLKNANVELRDRLHELKVNSAENDGEENKGDDRFQDEELISMRKNIQN